MYFSGSKTLSSSLPPTALFFFSSPWTDVIISPQGIAELLGNLVAGKEESDIPTGILSLDYYSKFSVRFLMVIFCCLLSCFIHSGSAWFILPWPDDEQNKITTFGFQFWMLRHAINKQINTYLEYFQVEKKSKGLSMLFLELCSSPAVINELAKSVRIDFQNTRIYSKLATGRGWLEERSWRSVVRRHCVF